MVTDRKIEDRKRAEKAVALLALAAETEADHGRCLSADEMAVLVDNGCEKEELARFRHHLSSCGKCYEVWVSLRRMQESGRRRGRIFRLSRFKKYSYIGTALAAAASVAVFLNIYLPQYSVDEKSVEDPVLMQQMSESALPQIPMPNQEIDVETGVESVEPMVPTATVSVQEEQLEDKIAPSVTREVFQGKMKKWPAPAARLNSQAVKKGLSAEVANDEASDSILSSGYALAEIESWLAEIKENCDGGRPEPDFWSDMHLQGEMILKKQSGSLPKEMEEKVTTVLRLLGQMNSDTEMQLCREILAFLP